MATKKAKTRGSTKLGASKKAAGSAALKKSVSALDRSALKNGIIIDGTPWPDIIRGNLTVKPSGLAGALNTLLKIPGARFKGFEVMPKGQPAIDQIVIKVNGKIKF